MSRLFQTLLVTIALVLPYSVKADTETRLPLVIEGALHDAAATGNPLVVDAIADRMSNLFPSYRGQINAYVEAVVDPATQVMASVNTMLADIPDEPKQGFAFFETHDMNEEAEAASLAQELNDLDVGAGEAVSAF